MGWIVSLPKLYLMHVQKLNAEENGKEIVLYTLLYNKCDMTCSRSEAYPVMGELRQCL